MDDGVAAVVREPRFGRRPRRQWRRCFFSASMDENGTDCGVLWLLLRLEEGLQSLWDRGGRDEWWDDAGTSWSSLLDWSTAAMDTVCREDDGTTSASWFSIEILSPPL